MLTYLWIELYKAYKQIFLRLALHQDLVCLLMKLDLFTILSATILLKLTLYEHTLYILHDPNHFGCLIPFNPCHTEYFYVLHSSPIFTLLTCTIPIASMFFQSEWKTVWIKIRWLCWKPVDLDLQCFQKSVNPGSAGQGLIIINVSQFHRLNGKQCVYWAEASWSGSTCTQFLGKGYV